MTRSPPGRAERRGEEAGRIPAQKLQVDSQLQSEGASQGQLGAQAYLDGDGLVGVAEDLDNATDRIFGTLTATLAAANGGANQNGHVTIVTSGRFPEVVNITAANGNVTLEAAPGVFADIDPVLAGNAQNAARQALPGIIVNAPDDRIVTLRSLTSRNWTVGALVAGGSRVVIEGCHFEGNTGWGIRVMDNARATITRSLVTASGFRVAAGVTTRRGRGWGSPSRAEPPVKF